MKPLTNKSGLRPYDVVFIRAVIGWTLKDPLANFLLTDLTASILQSATANIQEKLLEARGLHEVLTRDYALY
ncbi:MAG TPA: hypothetical protein VNO24_21215 [Blastocatellia bacterium]|nr:hypothetical protein [Blastocatellia bacterium]